MLYSNIDLEKIIFGWGSYRTVNMNTVDWDILAI